MDTPNKDIVENFIKSGKAGIKLPSMTKNQFNGVRVALRRNGNTDIIAVDRKEVGYFLINVELMKRQ